MFLYYYNYFSEAKTKNIEMKEQINFDYINLIFELNKLLNLYLNKETELISCQNYFNYLFNKHFFLIKELNSQIFSILINKFLELIS